MAVWVDSLLDKPGRPEMVMAATTLAMLSGGGTLIGASVVVAATFTGGQTWFTVAAAALAVVQVSAGVLLIVGAVRLAVGAGRGVLLTGVALQFLTCAVYALYAVTVVAGNPEDAPTMVVLILAIAGGVAVVTACYLHLALKPAVSQFLAAGHEGQRRNWYSSRRSVRRVSDTGSAGG